LRRDLLLGVAFHVSLESVELTCYTTLVKLTAFRSTYARFPTGPHVDGVQLEEVTSRF
jgi:hypothetical protein